MARRRTPRDLYQDVTDAILKTIESEPGTHVMPWHRGGAVGIPMNIESNNTYNGINIIILWATAQERGYSSPLWGTYKQWKTKGAQVRKGEKAAPVIFYKQIEVEPNPQDKKDDGIRHVIRGSSVFNADQVDGFELPSVTLLDPLERIAHAEAWLANTGAEIIEGGVQACYQSATDTIHMPDDRRFKGTDTMERSESYYSVAFHELTHWTSPEKRCHRQLGKRFGDKAYAIEEAIAEIGAAFQCAMLGLSPEPKADHAHYIAGWLAIMKADKKAIFTAAAKAQEAVNYIRELQPTDSPDAGERA